MSRKDSVSVVRREILDLNRVRVSVGAVVGRFEADRVNLYTIWQRNSDEGIVGGILIPFVPWLLAFAEKVRRNFLPSAASTCNGMSGLDAHIMLIKINPREPVHLVIRDLVMVLLYGLV